jgi:hypothetical protein
MDACWDNAIQECNIPANWPEPGVAFPLTPGEYPLGVSDTALQECCPDLQ